MRVVMLGPFGLRPRATMAARALPLARSLVARGHDLTVLLPPWQNPEDSGRCWMESGVAVENIHLPVRLPFLFHLLTSLRLARRALALRPDVIHFFKPKAYSGLTHWLLACLPLSHRPGLVVDTDDWEGPGGWNDLAPYSPIQRRFFAWQERWGLSHADAVTVASRTLESLVWAVGVPPKRVFYVPNGAPKAEGTNLQSATSPTLLLYTRFFEFPARRVVELLRLVREQVPETQLLVVGKGLFGEEEELLEEVEQAGLSTAVEYAGWEPERLTAHFAQASLAIYPFDDTLVNRTKCPAKLLELLAAGVPVVAEAVGEIREAIRHGETGWLVTSGDTEAFAEAVVRLLKDRALRERLSQAARQDMVTRRAWSLLAATAEQAYESAEEPSLVTRFLRRWLPPLALMAAIFAVSAQPSLPHVPKDWLDLLLKKLGHASAYGLLAWLYLRALRGNTSAAGRLRLLSLVLAVIYAVTDEVHQSFVPGRHPSPLDVLIDGAGAALAMGLDRLQARTREPVSR